MIPRIRIEEHPATFAGLDAGIVHLYLVYQGELGDEYVLRSGPRHALQLFGGEMKIEANVPIAQSADARGDDTPAERSSTELTFAGSTADQAWAIMVKYARMLDDLDYKYSAIEENSNTFIAALLYACGGTPSSMLPTGTSASQALGYSNWGNIIGDVPPPTDGIIYGTSRADSLLGMQIIDVIRALGGNDSVSAGAGADRIYGGTGLDRLRGQDGNDRIWGEAGDDTLWGGAGRDQLTGGRGNDRHVGGPGADTFHFFAGDGRDRIDDFVPGTDRLAIHSTLASEFDDLVVSQSGVNGADTRIALGVDSIVLRNVDFDDFGHRDVLIA